MKASVESLRIVNELDPTSNDLEKLIGQNIQVKTVNQASSQMFSTKGILTKVNDKFLVIKTIIGTNQNHKDIIDDMIIMMRNVVAISKNPWIMIDESKNSKTTLIGYQDMSEKINDKYEK